MFSWWPCLRAHGMLGYYYLNLPLFQSRLLYPLSLQFCSSVFPLFIFRQYPILCFMKKKEAMKEKLLLLPSAQCINLNSPVSILWVVPLLQWKGEAQLSQRPMNPLMLHKLGPFLKTFYFSRPFLFKFSHSPVSSVSLSLLDHSHCHTTPIKHYYLLYGVRQLEIQYHDMVVGSSLGPAGRS